MQRILFFLLLFTGAVGSNHAQNYPVRIAPILSPPYTPFLTDYIEAGSDKLALHITLNDVTIPQYRCKLRVTIEGVNISVTTHPNFTPQPLSLAGGVPEILYGSDLSEYFKASNLIFKGISLEDFEKKGSQLPEGIYRFSFEVLDYNRGTVVSNIGSATAWMILNDPPIINLPLNNAKLKPLNPQNLVFQWTPRHRGSPNAAFTTEYDVKLVEIWPQGRNPYDAINTALPIFETTTDNTLVVYGPAETPLVLGREYALQVRARDTGGKDLFKNKGYSEVVRFLYGDECPIPSSLSADEIGTLKARLKWQGSNLNTGYTLRYRESRDGAEWFEQRTDQTYINASDMKPGTTYEYEVCGECETFRSEYSQEQKFKTLAENPNAFVCKDPNTIPMIDGSPPLPVLMPNDTIKAGGFHVIVSQAMGNNGNFSGKGVAIVPWFNGAKVNVTFENISVNKSHQLTKGVINSVWDPTSKFLIDVPNVLSEKGQTQLETIAATFEADTLIKTSGVILSVFINPADKNIVVQTTGGETIITRSEGKAYAITDQSGNGFLVDKDGKITKATAEIATTAASRGERNYNTNPNVGLHFVRTSDTKYGYDEQRDGTLTQNYQQASNGKSIAWKALSTGQTESLQGITEGRTKSEKVKFKLEGLNSQDLVATADLRLQLTGQAEGTIEEVLAYYVETDTAKHPPILAKINTISYSAIQKNLVVVRVNGAPLSIDPSSLKQRLNEIYQQAVVSWSTVQLEELTVNGVNTKNLDDGESGLLSNYTADMRAIINAYTSNQPLAAETYYLFLVEQAHNPAKLGYMPRKKQAGFIFTQPHSSGSNNIVVTMAHELAHGAFRLEHTFSEFPALALEKGTTDNLLDYKNGIRLNKYQWDNIHDPVSMLSLFDDDDEGALSSLDVITIFLKDNGIPISYKGIPGILRAFGFNASKKEIRFKITKTVSNPKGLGQNIIEDEVDALFARVARHVQSKIEAKEFTKTELEQWVLSNQEDIKKYLEGLIKEIEQSGLEDMIGLSEAESSGLKNSIRKFKDQQGIDPAVTVVDETLFNLLKSQYESGAKKPTKDVHLIVDRTGKAYNFFYKAGLFKIPTEKIIESTGEAIQLDGSPSEIFAIRDQVIAKAVANDYIQGIGKINEPTLNIFEKGMWVIKVTKETLEEVKVPVPIWDKKKESSYPFNLESTVAGIGDGVVDEFKSVPDLLIMGLSMFDKEERDALITAVSSINLETIQAMFEEKASKYAQGGDVARHEGGYDAVQIASMFWGGVFIKGKKAVDKADEVLGVLQKVSQRIKDKIARLSAKQRDELLRDLGSSEELLSKFTPEMVDSWKKLFHSSISEVIRKNPVYLDAVAKTIATYGEKLLFQFERVLPHIASNDYDRFFSALSKPKSIHHVQSLIGDFENIPGISLSKYSKNSLPNEVIPAPNTWANPLLALPGETAITFTRSATAKVLSPGQKIYRVLGQGQNPSGGFWTYELPTSKADLFGDTAVRPEWNSATHYVEYTVPSDGLKIWEGPTASQPVLPGIDEVNLPGGGIQIFVPDPYRQVGNGFDNLELKSIDLP